MARAATHSHSGANSPMVDDRLLPLHDVVGDQLTGCLACCIGCLTCGNVPQVRVHGIPRRARLCTPEEQAQLQAPLQGQWTINMLPGRWFLPGADRNAQIIQYTDMVINGNTILIQGGMHNQTVHHGSGSRGGGMHQTAVVNKPQEQYLKFWQDAQDNNRLYIERTGSYVEFADFANGVVILRNSVGFRMGLVRVGFPPPAALPPSPPEPNWSQWESM